MAKGLGLLLWSQLQVAPAEENTPETKERVTIIDRILNRVGEEVEETVVREEVLESNSKLKFMAKEYEALAVNNEGWPEWKELKRGIGVSQYEWASKDLNISSAYIGGTALKKRHEVIQGLLKEIEASGVEDVELALAEAILMYVQTKVPSAEIYYVDLVSQQVLLGSGWQEPITCNIAYENARGKAHARGFQLITIDQHQRWNSAHYEEGSDSACYADKESIIWFDGGNRQGWFMPERGGCDPETGDVFSSAGNPQPSRLVDAQGSCPNVGMREVFPLRIDVSELKQSKETNAPN